MSAGGKERSVASADQSFRAKELFHSLPAKGEQKSTLNQLECAMKNNDRSSVEELATKFLVSTVDSRRRTSTLTEEQLKMMLRMADKDKFSKELQKNDIDKIQTASETYVDITSVTSVDFGSAVTSDQPGGNKEIPTENKKFKEAEQKQQPSQHIEKISEDRQKELDEKNNEIIQLEKKKVEAERLVKEKQGELEKIKKEKTDLENTFKGVEKKQKENIDEINKAHSDKIAELKNEIKDRQTIIIDMEKKLESLNSETTTLHSKLKMAEQKIKDNEKQYKKAFEKVYTQNKAKLDSLLEDHAKEMSGKNRQLQELVLERDEIRNRFSKLAGEKLTNQNADIADLSDPNRAMKLSEKFGELYDNEWTDAFEALKGKKVSAKDAIQFLLDILQRCVMLCAKLRDTQMDSLKNVLLHPAQDVSMFPSEPRKHGQKDRPRISSKDEKATLALRRQIGTQENILDEVKQVFVMETKSSDKSGFNKKHLELCIPYLHKCAEICWLMVIHDPPLYVKFDAKHGDKLDPNYYTVYASTGEKIDFLVWPPLLNEEKGGLLSKGVAQPFKMIKK